MCPGCVYAPVRPSRPADHEGVIFRGFELVQSWCAEPVVHDRWSMVHVPVSVDVYEPDERQVWQLALFVGRRGWRAPMRVNDDYGVRTILTSTS